MILALFGFPGDLPFIDGRLLKALRLPGQSGLADLKHCADAAFLIGWQFSHERFDLHLFLLGEVRISIRFAVAVDCRVVSRSQPRCRGRCGLCR